ncbi:hypothetical protein CCMA1212_004507, partial [Trichoderma ghanense]
CPLWRSRQTQSFYKLQSTQSRSLPGIAGKEFSEQLLGAPISPTMALAAMRAVEARSMSRPEPHDGSISAYWRYGMPRESKSKASQGSGGAGKQAEEEDTYESTPCSHAVVHMYAARSTYAWRVAAAAHEP